MRIHVPAAVPRPFGGLRWLATTSLIIALSAVTFGASVWELRIDIPAAAVQGVRDISSNSRGVVGVYCDFSNSCWNYLWHRGALTTIAIPGAEFNRVSSVNSSGDVVGHGFRQGSAYGYLRRVDGTITRISCPFATDVEPAAINNARMIAGIWFNAKDGSRGAFVWRNGRCERLPVGAVAYPQDISSNGIIVGDAGASSEFEPFYAFMLRHGDISVVEHPEAPFAAGGGTGLLRVAPNGLAVGWFIRDATSEMSSGEWFVYRDGLFDRIDIPSMPLSVSSQGVITYEDNDHVIRAVRVRSHLTAY